MRDRTPQAGPRHFQPVLMVLHLAVAVAVMAAGTHAAREIFRATRRVPLLPAAFMSLEIALIFQWGLYYATHSDTVRRVVRSILWLHVVFAPLVVGILLGWPEVVLGQR